MIEKHSSANEIGTGKSGRLSDITDFSFAKITPLLSLLFVIAILFLSSQHYTIAALLMLIFSLIALGFNKKHSRLTRVKIANLVTLVLSIGWACIAYRGYSMNQSDGCTGFWGVQVECFSQQDFSYLYIDAILAAVQIILIFVLLSAFVKIRNNS